MKYVMNIHSIAGYCNVSVLWRMIMDLSSSLQVADSFRVLMPDSIVIEGDCFRIDYSVSNKTIEEFFPPEGFMDLGESGVVWSLGAMVCYASSGHYIFGGRGGAYQRSHPHVELPVLKKEHSELTPLVQRCLCYTPSQRITLQELYTNAMRELENNRKKTRMMRINHSQGVNSKVVGVDDIWPESMI